VITPGATSPGYTCAGFTGGVAFVPDGSSLLGSGATSGSLTIIPFETTSGAFSAACPQTKLSLPYSINDFVISSEGIAIALQSDNRYIGIDQIVSGGTPNTFQNPQSFPSPSGNTFTANSLAIVSNGTAGIAMGPNYEGFVGINNFFGLAPTPLPTATGTATPTPTPTQASVGTTPTPTVTQTPVPYAGLIPFDGVGSTNNANTGLNPASGYRYSVEFAPNDTTILARGTDLATFSLDSTLSGYYITFPADTSTAAITSAPPNGISTTLGFPNGTPPTGNAAKGLIAFFPGDSSQAIVGQTPTSPLTATYITGLPNSIAPQKTIVVPTAGGQINSIAVTPNDGYAIIGTNTGIYVANISSGNPILAPNAATGVINSVGVSPDGNFVVAQSRNKLNVYPFSNGTIGAISGTFTLPATTTGDYLVVR